MRTRRNRLMPAHARRIDAWCIADTQIETALRHQLGLDFNWFGLADIVRRELTMRYPYRRHCPVRIDLKQIAFGHLETQPGETDEAYDGRRLPWLDTFSLANFRERYLARTRGQQLVWMQTRIEQLLDEPSRLPQRHLVVMTTEGWGLERALGRACDEGYRILIIGTSTNRDFWQCRGGVEFILADDLPLRYIEAMVCTPKTLATRRLLAAA